MQLPDFVRAYEPDGMTPAEFIDFGLDAADAEPVQRDGVEGTGELLRARWPPSLSFRNLATRSKSASRDTLVQARR